METTIFTMIVNKKTCNPIWSSPWFWKCFLLQYPKPEVPWLFYKLSVLVGIFEPLNQFSHLGYSQPNPFYRFVMRTTSAPWECYLELIRKKAGHKYEKYNSKHIFSQLSSFLLAQFSTYKMFIMQKNPSSSAGSFKCITTKTSKTYCDMSSSFLFAGNAG